MSDRYHYRGDLEDRPLPEMLYTIYQHRVPGVVQVTCDDDTKRVYVRDGAVVYASSSDLQESLGCFLLRKGRISREDFKALMRQRRDSDERLGALLVEKDLMAPAELQRAIRRQSAEILWNLFAWSRGIVTFSIGDFAEPSAVLVQIPIRQVIKEGVGHIKNVAGLLQRVGRRDTVLEASYKIEDLIDTSLRKEELELLRRVDGKRNLLELCSGGPLDRSQCARLLYVFHVLEFVRACETERSSSIKIRLKSIRT